MKLLLIQARFQLFLCPAMRPCLRASLICEKKRIHIQIGAQFTQPSEAVLMTYVEFIWAKAQQRPPVLFM